VSTRSLAAAFVCGALIGGAPVAVATGPPRSAGDESRIASLVTRWFASLAARDRAGFTPRGFLAESPLGFALAATSDPGPDDLAAWLDELRSPHPHVEFRIDALLLDVVDGSTVRASFTLLRRARDAAGLPHVARSEQTWLIRDSAAEVPVVLRIEERRLLAFPGTGPQMVCY
jgi:hypothetical protein